MKKIILIIYACFLNFSVFANREIEETFIFEKTKEFKFNAKLSGNEKLEICNKFGNVHVRFGSTKQVSITVEIIVKSNNESIVEQSVDQMQPEFKNKNGTISVRTCFDFYKKYCNKESKMQINYEIVMPDFMPLNLSNSHGDVELPSFKAPLSLNLDYCNLKFEKVTSETSNIKLNFCKVKFDELNGGSLSSNYGKIQGNKIQNVVINDNYGNIQVKTVSDIDGSLNYTKGNFDRVFDDIKFNLNYSNNITIDEIDKHIKSFMLISNYSNINLPINNEFRALVDAKGKYCNFPLNPEVNFMYNGDNSKQQKKPNGENTFKATIGSTNQTQSKITIICTYGRVKLGD
ncbi:MAG: hypothetical protein ACRCVT_07340 [Leadbetterella sp.]